jgi:hypothetical protein
MSIYFEASGSIVIGNSQSNCIQFNELTAVGLTTGSNITGTTLSFLVSNNNIDFYPLYDSTGTEVTISASSVARSYALSPLVFFPWNFMKLREGTSSSAVLQSGVDTSFKINTKYV